MSDVCCPCLPATGAVQPGAAGGKGTPVPVLERVSTNFDGSAHYAVGDDGTRCMSRLKQADALQLGAAFVASERRPSTLEFVCLDDRLNDAARREGFVTPV